MFDALSAEDPGRITVWLAHHEGDLVAATIAIRVGTHAWYSYGASSTEKRDVRGSNAVQWAMIRDALDAGAEVYDLRGITDTLDADDPHVGLIQFKVGTGGEAVEYAGEWDLPLNQAALQGLRALPRAARMTTERPPDEPHAARRRRPLAHPPAGGRRGDPRPASRWSRATATASRSGGSRGARPGSVSTRWRSGPTPSCPRSRPGSPGDLLVLSPWRPGGPADPVTGSSPTCPPAWCTR